MKKLFVWILAVLMLINLSACSEKADADNSKTIPAVTAASNTKNSSGESTKDKKESGVITISASSAPEFLKHAAGRYHELNPGVTIEIKDYLPMKIVSSGNTSIAKKSSTEDVEKYINTINTELMGGKGSDIILIDKSLPYQKYIERNLFVDMNKMMQSDGEFTSSKYYMNIFKTLEYKKGLYTIPIDFYFPMVSSAKDMSPYINDSTWTYEDFFNSSQKTMTGLKYISASTDSDIFESLFANSWSSLVNLENKSADFASGRFANLLKQCKAMSDKNLLGKLTNKNFKGDMRNSLFDFNLILSAAVMKASTTQSSDNNKKFLYRLPTIDGKKSVAFDSSPLYAINKNSKNSKLAWNFIKFLLSDEMQTSAELVSFPVKKDAFRIKQKESFKLYFKDLSESETESLTDQYCNSIDKIISDINAYQRIDPKINKIVMDEANNFFTGKQSAEDAARAIQNKVNIYLKE